MGLMVLVERTPGQTVRWGGGLKCSLSLVPVFQRTVVTIMMVPGALAIHWSREVGQHQY